MTGKKTKLRKYKSEKCPNCKGSYYNLGAHMLKYKRRKKVVIKDSHKRIAKRMSERVGKDGKRMTLGKAIRAEGYSKKTSETPQKITKTKSWQALMEQAIGDEKLSRVHAQLLRASNIGEYSFPAKESDKVIAAIIDKMPGCKLITIRPGTVTKRVYFSVPDNKSRKEALDMAYKLKGKYSAKKFKFVDPLEEFNDDEIEEELERRGYKRPGKDTGGTAKE